MSGRSEGGALPADGVQLAVVRDQRRVPGAVSLSDVLRRVLRGTAAGAVA